MGLVKRGTTWWMSFMYQGQQVRRSTGTADKRLAEAILGQVRIQIIEGRFFEKPEAQHRTLAELMDRYASEHAARRASHRRELTSVKNLTTFFGNPTLDQITPKRIVAYKNQRYTDGVKPATINRELATLKKAFNLARREWEWCTDNPVCRVSMERENNTRDRWLTMDEETRLFNAAGPWLRELMLFAIHTACGWERSSASSGLGWICSVERSRCSNRRMANDAPSRSIRPRLHCSSTRLQAVRWTRSWCFRAKPRHG